MSTGRPTRSSTFRHRQSPFRRFALSLTERAFDTAIYRATLQGRFIHDQFKRDPSILALCKVIDPWTGSAEIANEMFQGRFSAAGKSVRTIGQSPWSLTPPSEAWIAELCRFTWLRHFRAAGGQAASHLARDLVSSWLDANKTFDALSWRPEILAARIGSWLAHGDFLLHEATSDFHHEFLSSLHSQAHHLARSVNLSAPGAPRITAHIGLALAGVAFDGRERWLTKAKEALNLELDLQFLGDGGHYERNPSVHHEILRDLIMLAKALRTNNLQSFYALDATIDGITHLLQFFRHGDGGLALFNGSHEDDRREIDSTLSLVGKQRKSIMSAQQTGYERLKAVRTLVLFDVGTPPPDDVADRAHAGALSFEMSVGSDRLIVNCGVSASSDSDWQTASRSTAAHSTLTLDATNSLSLKANGSIGRRPRQMEAVRSEDPNGVTVTANHDGYNPTFGVIHHRRLHLSTDGSTLRGFDKLVTSGIRPLSNQVASAPDYPFIVRFHLHPAIRASLLESGATILLRGPGRMGWSFEASNGEMRIEDSVYLGTKTGARRSEQIIIIGSLRRTPNIEWVIDCLHK